MTIVYTATVDSLGDGRSGTARSDDGRLEVTLTAPQQPGGTNPEQLFAAGYSACFHSALRLSAREAGITVPGSTVHATVHLIRDDNGYRLAADLVAVLPGIRADVATMLVGQAHQRCPYSRAVTGNIEVTVRATDQQLTAG
ncbi:organic hydroperoxide resistance protein [Winogradskya consettensis]|jgi:osmotically inducible protein OsmC|uniref:Organic hydroperoxide resistance protein n=1 Tax=Winogradskya consettensis TaxID=113560 RepID=A0A919S9F4_9ACTN|nr:Ohr family peroxiredoxin [Actinoplanes consettensis]GIM68296.1 organic hydroperoxide resistance protein [Actinoplanes consettensis]